MTLTKTNKLFIVLTAILLANAVTAEFIGVKLFSLEQSLGFAPLNLSIGNWQNISITMSAGVISWPIVFTITDIVNDYFGVKGVKFISYLTAAIVIFVFIVVYIAIHLSPDNFWITSQQNKGIENMQNAFVSIFGQGLYIIIGSIIAFLIGQIVDAFVFKTIKKNTRHKHIWVRALLSTFVSQIIDSFVVLYIAFYIGQGFDFSLVTMYGCMNSLYKITLAIALLPLVYIGHFAVEKYLGKEQAQHLISHSIH